MCDGVYKKSRKHHYNWLVDVDDLLCIDIFHRVIDLGINLHYIIFPCSHCLSCWLIWVSKGYWNVETNLALVSFTIFEITFRCSLFLRVHNGVLVWTFKIFSHIRLKLALYISSHTTFIYSGWHINCSQRDMLLNWGKLASIFLHF